jgi:hypothetical protein
MYTTFIDWVAKISQQKEKKTYGDYWKLPCVYLSLLTRRQISDRANEEGTADHLLLKCCRREPLASTSTLAYGLTTMSASASNRTHHEPAEPKRSPAPASPDGVRPPLLFLH